MHHNLGFFFSKINSKHCVWKEQNKWIKFQTQYTHSGVFIPNCLKLVAYIHRLIECEQSIFTLFLSMLFIYLLNVISLKLSSSLKSILIPTLKLLILLAFDKKNRMIILWTKKQKNSVWLTGLAECGCYSMSAIL